jgi:two-component system chemotaxis response regulator CheY
MTDTPTPEASPAGDRLAAELAQLRVEPASPSPDSDPEPVAHACDVLIADDTGAAREILSALLRQFCIGVSIREARDGASALIAWRQLQPRVTFLDIDMPVHDGLSVLKTIRLEKPDAFVAMVSGHSSADNVRQALGTGASGFIVKPFKPQRVIDVLDRYRKLSGHALMDAG